METEEKGSGEDRAERLKQASEEMARLLPKQGWPGVDQRIALLKAEILTLTGGDHGALPVLLPKQARKTALKEEHEQAAMEPLNLTRFPTPDQTYKAEARAEEVLKHFFREADKIKDPKKEAVYLSQYLRSLDEKKGHKSEGGHWLAHDMIYRDVLERLDAIRDLTLPETPEASEKPTDEGDEANATEATTEEQEHATDAADDEETPGNVEAPDTGQQEEPGDEAAAGEKDALVASIPDQAAHYAEQAKPILSSHISVDAVDFGATTHPNFTEWMDAFCVLADEMEKGLFNPAYLIDFFKEMVARGINRGGSARSLQVSFQRELKKTGAPWPGRGRGKWKVDLDQVLGLKDIWRDSQKLNQ